MIKQMGIKKIGGFQPENIIAGQFDNVREVVKVSENLSIGSLLTYENGVCRLIQSLSEQVYGVLAETSIAGNDAVVWRTGEFFASGVTVGAGVNVSALVDPTRGTIFLRGALPKPPPPSKKISSEDGMILITEGSEDGMILITEDGKIIMTEGINE